MADTGNNRIVMFDRGGNFDRVITAAGTPLNKPQGLFVDGQDNLYVADTGNARVVKLDTHGKLLKEFKLPKSRFIPETYRFEPIKVAVDKRGFLFVNSLGSYNGLMQLDPDGKFVRFFAANEAPFTVLDSLKRMIYTREMYEKQPSKLPPAINNVDIDSRGFLYTVSYGENLTSGQVKKLNNAGKNFLGTDSTVGGGNDSFGEVRFRRVEEKGSLKDIAVDGNGNFTVIDSVSKMVSQYDAFGSLLFFWSGDASPNTTQLGIVKSPAAVETNSTNDLFILDDNANLIQMFRQTEFGALVYKANNLTLDGKYKEAEALWREVLHLNAYYTPAMLGLAQAAYGRGDYTEAKRLYYDAGLQDGYSNSFWQIRLGWFQERFGLFMNTVLGLGLLYLVFRAIAKRYRLSWGTPRFLQRRWPLAAQLRHALYILRHPVDGFTALRYESKGSVASAVIILVLAYLSYAVARTQTSFTFNAEAIRPAGAATIFLQFFLVWVAWIVSNYLVSSIRRGKAGSSTSLSAAPMPSPLDCSGAPAYFPVERHDPQ
ncbi:SMP-30/gluconolactonase/LRE family protein [Paenibacillus sp. CC-CFT747]|nr:SMP-30/gluconolactonase/LRE family protein [Paenibacillus sp. CC-CFT747]